MCIWVGGCDDKNNGIVSYNVHTGTLRWKADSTAAILSCHGTIWDVSHRDQGSDAGKVGVGGISDKHMGHTGNEIRAQ